MSIFFKKKWLWVGLIIALVNPVFAGLVIGAAYLSEPELKKSGIIVATVAIIWGAFMVYFAGKIFPAGPMGL